MVCANVFGLSVPSGKKLTPNEVSVKSPSFQNERGGGGGVLTNFLLAVKVSRIVTNTSKTAESTLG